MNNKKVYTYAELDEDQQYYAACLHNTCPENDDNTDLIVLTLYTLDFHGMPEIYHEFKPDNPVIAHYIKLIRSSISDEFDYLNLITALEIVKRSDKY